MTKNSFLKPKWILRATLIAVFLLLSGEAANISAQTPVTHTTGTLSQINVKTFTSTNIDTTLGTSNLTQLPSPVFTYQKLSTKSVLKITYQDTVSNTGSFASTCVYQIRVDGQPSLPSSLASSSTPILIVSNLGNTSLSSVGIFKGLSKGEKKISIWHKQAGATQCIRNSGGFTTTLIVEEFEVNE